MSFYLSLSWSCMPVAVLGSGPGSLHSTGTKLIPEKISSWLDSSLVVNHSS